MNKPTGLKLKIEKLLLGRSSASKALSILEISQALGLSKAEHPDISSCLVKLRSSGRTRCVVGPSVSNKGRRSVKKHYAVPEKESRIIVVREDDLRRQMGFAK